MPTLVRSLRRALKRVTKQPTYSGTVLATLAICIGANVAIYSVIHTLILEPLPFDESERLVTVFNAYPGAGAPRAGSGSVDFFRRRAEVDAFEEVAIYRSGAAAVGDPGDIEQVTLLRTTPSLFPLLRVEAEIGRTFLEEEMEDGDHQRVLLTHGYWEETFGSDPDVVGRDLRVDGEPYRIVGVLPPDFGMPNRSDVRLVLPTRFDPADRDLQNWHNNNFQMIARLAPGRSLAQGQSQIDALNQRLIDEWPVPNARQILEDAGFSTTVTHAGPDLVRDVEDVLYMLWAGVGLLLLIGCVNIANLELARAQSQAGDVATKLALGAQRARIGTQALTEAVAMALMGGLLGLGVGWVGLNVLLSAGAADLPRGAEVAIDGPVIGFTLAVAVGAGLLFGAIPTLQLMRGELAPVFRTETRTGTASRKAVLVRNGMVTGQVALAFVMLVGAGLMLESFRSALAVDPGFDPNGVLTGYVALPQSRYADGDARRQFWDRFLPAVEASPGVQRAGLVSSLPFSGNNSSSVVTPEGYEPRPGESLLSPVQSVASPGYFEAMGIEVEEGRPFLASDGPDAVQVMVIDRWLADRYWPDGGAIGDRMIWGAIPGQDSIPEEALYTIVGIVETIKHQDLTAPVSDHVGAYYGSLAQRPFSFLTLVARSRAGGPAALTPAVRGVLADLDPELPFFDVRTMASRVDESLTQRRIPLVLLGVFAAVALFLALVGIYGTLAYTVKRRTREIGIRMAMGSEPERIFTSVVRRGLTVTAVGLATGAVIAFSLSRLVESLLFGVEPTEPRVALGVAAIILVAGLAASIVPARRATSIDPMSAIGG